MWWWVLFSVLLVVAVVALPLLVVWLCFGERSRPPVWSPGRDCFFLDAQGKQSGSLPRTDRDKPTLDLSVVVPAYNECLRLPTMLDEALEWLTNSGLSWEIIVVDDGSSDDTAHMAAERYSSKWTTDRVRVLRLHKNRGKGGAVRWGMLQARGRQLLMVDADGATRFSDLARLRSEMALKGLSVVVGSRAHQQDEAVARRTFLRNLLMWGFHLAVHLVGVHGIRDTQCGFKLFTREAAAKLFPALHVERWAFDVELLLLAQRLKMPIGEVPVNWSEIDGSKLDPLRATAEMLRDMVRIRAAYALGVWRVWS